MDGIQMRRKGGGKQYNVYKFLHRKQKKDVLTNPLECISYCEYDKY